MNRQQPDTAEFASSTGHALAEANYLDHHYETCRAEYEAMLRSVGIQPGWHVLDAACGSGCFFPLLSELVGSTGRITALDIAPENARVAAARIARGTLRCPTAVDIGDVMALPYSDDTFDAVWFANTSQYLTDDELARTVNQFRRVVRSGGLIGLKEADTRFFGMHPADHRLFWRWLMANDTVPQRGCRRSRSLGRWLERAGLAAVWTRTTLVERWAPLCPIERPFLASILAWFAGEAEKLPLSEADRAEWRAISDPASPRYLLDQPDFCYDEGSIVTVGRVP